MKRFIPPFLPRQSQSGSKPALSTVMARMLLVVITEQWVDYLTQMEALRVSIGLEVYGQRDSLVQFKSKAFELLQNLLKDMRSGVISRMFTYRLRDALLDRSIFYLVWQSGLRLGEVEELRLEDLDLSSCKLTVRNGKGLKDRTVYMTDTTVGTLKAYLAVRGPGLSDHVFLYRHQALKKDLLHARIRVARKRTGVKVYPHRLRHTTATQLLNAGCPVTSIQKFLGYKKLNTTMVYAHAHDQTVENDYFAAMQRIERRLELVDTLQKVVLPVTVPERHQLLSSAE